MIQTSTSSSISLKFMPFLSISPQLFIDFLSFCLLQQILTANINTYSEVENALQPIIMAQKVRIYPYSQYDRTVCLRAEMIGCSCDGEFRFHLFICVCKNKKSSFWPRRLRVDSSDLCMRANCATFLYCSEQKKFFNLIEETYARQTFPVQK